ncbi:AfsR/SARP family transcriptional regulator [Streptomyces anulatus]
MEFSILGATEVRSGGSRIPLTAAKQRTVLAALLISPGRFVSDAWLGDLLWGTTPPATKSAQLYTYVSRLRRSCGPGLCLVRRHRGYSLVLGDAWFDWEVFQQLAEKGRVDVATNRYAEAANCLERALALWKGPALADVTEFLTRSELPLLEEARLRAVDNRAAAVLALGRHDSALPELARLVAEHPTRESLRGHLMTALYRCDRQMDALRVYEQGRRILKEELGVDPGASLRRLHRAVLDESLPGPAAAEPLILTAPIAGGVPRTDAVTATGRYGALSPWIGLAPAMLPMGPPGFVGRRAELADILARLCERDDGRRGVSLSGAIGTGKSALAVHVGHACRDEFRQGQLYIDLRDEGGGAKDPLDVLGCFLRALMPLRGEDLPATLDERVQLYRSALSRRRVLVVLDNAVDDRQIRPLLASGPGCRVLITGRRPLASLEGVSEMRVGRLDDAGARELLESTMGADRLDAEPESTRALLDLCDGLPLALRFSAARLVARSQCPVSRLVDRLSWGGMREEEWGEGTHDLRNALRAAVMRLDAPLRPVLGILARTEQGAFTPADAARRLNRSESRARGALDTLVESGLLESAAPPAGPPSGRPGPARPYYRCTPLVRLLILTRGPAAPPSAPEGPRPVSRPPG